MQFHRLIPESPRWLVAHDQLDEAKSIIEAFGSKDEKPLDSEAIRSLLEEVRREQIEREKTAKKYNPIHMFLTPKLRKWTAIICYQWYDKKTNKQTCILSCACTFFNPIRVTKSLS